MSAQGKYISRVCVIHIASQSCLYDRIWPGDEDLWLSSDEKYDEDEYAMGIKFAVSGTKKERMMRTDLISLIKSFYQISRSIDDGSVFKAAFQLPAENRQSNFTVKFTPHFGTLARPKKNINTKISSMVFGQAQTEMVIGSKNMPYKTRKEKKNMKKSATTNVTKESQQLSQQQLNEQEKKKKDYSEFVCAVFYGVNVKPEIAAKLSKQLIDEFFENFQEELQTLLIRLDHQRRDNQDSDNESDDDDDDDELALNLDYSKDTENSNKNQEYIMAQFKKFDEVVIRIQTRVIDRKDRNYNNYRKHKTTKT